jgi:exoribonuclease R
MYSNNDNYIDYLSRTNFKDWGIDPKTNNLSDYLYSKDNDNNLVLKTIPGILEFNSNISSTCKKRGFVKKKFTPFISNLPSVMVPTNKIRQKRDMYVIINLTLGKSKDSRSEINILTGSVEKYLEEVDQSYNPKNSIMNNLTTSQWRRKINRNYELSISNVDLMKNDRTDYYNDRIYTIAIDPDNCQDVDDAVSICELKDNLFEMGIHIADPTSYLIEGSDLDNEVLNRSESIYLNNDTIHMFPEELTKNIFSLKADKICRAFTILFDVSINDMNISNIRFLKTFVKLNKNISYDEFSKTIETDSKHNQLYSIGKSLYSKLIDSSKSIFEFDSKKMVQAFMVYANSLVANKLSSNPNKYNMIIRSQPRISINQNNYTNKVDNNLFEKHCQLQWSSANLKLYSGLSEKDSHQGVGLDLYTQFTSPIRRYSDILIHRLLWNIVKEDTVFKLECVKDRNYLHTLFKLNHNKRFYKSMSRFERDWLIYDKISDLFDVSDRTLEFDCSVINIDSNNKCAVIINNYCNNDEEYELINKLFKGMLIRASIYNNKMIDSLLESSKLSGLEYAKQITEYNFVKNSNIIKSVIDTRNNYKINIFDNIKIEITFIKNVRRFKACVKLY